MKRSTATAALAFALMGGLSIGAIPIAAATPNMNIDATGGAGTTIDHDGTQGDFVSAVQGTVDVDGYQDAFNAAKSEKAAPQDQAPNKTTK